jgi:hypothetical protein
MALVGSHRPAPPRHPSRLWLGLMAAAVTGIVVPPTILAARAAAPQVTAAGHLSLPEWSPEPVAHGGPLALPSIGVVATGPLSVPVPSETARTHNDPATTRQARTAAHSGAAATLSAQPDTETTTWQALTDELADAVEHIIDGFVWRTDGPRIAALAVLGQPDSPTPSEPPTSSPSSTEPTSPDDGATTAAPSSATSASAPIPALPETPLTGADVSACPLRAIPLNAFTPASTARETTATPVYVRRADKAGRRSERYCSRLGRSPGRRVIVATAEDMAMTAPVVVGFVLALIIAASRSSAGGRPTPTCATTTSAWPSSRPR